VSASQVLKTARDGQLTIIDGTGSPNTLIVQFEDGDFSFSDDKAERIVMRDRGAIVGLRKGDDSVPSFSFSVYMREFMDSSAVTIIDVIEGTNGASGWLTTGVAGFEQTLFDIEMEVEGTAHGDAGDHQLTMTRCFLNWDFAEAKEGNKITITGEVYGTVSRTEAS
jgi:hypothetical protein